MAFPTDGYTPNEATYTLSAVDGDFNSTTLTIVSPAWSQHPGWQDALETAVGAFRDSLATSIGDVTVHVDRSLTAVVSGPVV